MNIHELFKKETNKRGKKENRLTSICHDLQK